MEQPTDNHVIVIINDSNKKIIMGTDIVQTSITYTFMIVTDAENMAKQIHNLILQHCLIMCFGYDRST